MYPFLVLFILVVISSICKGQHANLCNVIPKDLYIEMGSDIEVLCQTSCASGKIFWTLNSRPIDESLSNVINSSLTVLSLRTFTHHNATLQCHSANTQQILGGTTIRTYTKPSKLSCFFHYKNQHVDVVPHLFTCKWEHQMNSSLKIHYTVLYASLLRPSYTEICSSYVTTCTSKDIDLSDKVHFFGNASVIVRAKATAWEAYSNPYEFDHYDILQMIRPEVTVTAFPDHLLVEWTRSPSTRTCHCQVKYGKAVSDRTPENVQSTTLDPSQKGEYTIQSVESCTHYNILVRCALDKAPWSDWSRETTVLTKLNKSDVKLHLWRKVAEPKKNAIRNVHIMWTEIPSTCQGTFTYTIQQTPYKNYMTGANSTGSLCYSSPCDIDVNQDAHRINLTVFHGEILLTEDSVYVPATVESLLKVTDLQTSNLKGVILVSWKAPLQPVSGYMIDWTHNGNQYYWKESKYTNTRLLDLLDKKPYNITVTPLFGDKTGHGTQALQICSRVGNPGNVTIISVEAKDKSAILSWSTRSQEECSGAVINYTVFYGTQKGPTLNVTVDYTKQDLCLKDLDPDTQYSVYVKATALTGTSKSSERLFKTKRYDPRLSMALGVGGSIIIFLVLSLGLCCAIQWKKFREKPVPNPGHSSVALWSSPSYQKGMCHFQPFSNPPKSIYDQVYTVEPQRAPTSALATDCNGNQASDQAEEHTDPVIHLSLDAEDEKPVELVETQHLCCPGESTSLLSSGNSSFTPYRSQGSVETPAKQCKCVPVKQLEKTAPVTVYVTLDMFEQGQSK
uniref:interleukin-6 receptor subunit beta-like n=1 Tax=Monopterus albus TaxID=43700 RepID=UPI0009B34F7F|nr:interleukin-6 receptor subunit beta-like [Monopterus albus]